MKRNGSYLRQYLPWLGLLLGVDALAALLLWLADARAFAAMAAVIVLATVFLFAGVCTVLCARAKRREQAFTAFLATRTRHTNRHCDACSPPPNRKAFICSAKRCARSSRPIAQLQTQMDDYEDYVELWAHEVKMPLALLTLVLDNRRDTLRRRSASSSTTHATGCRRSLTRCSTMRACAAHGATIGSSA